MNNVKLAALRSSAPRGLASAVLAEANPAELIKEMKNTVDDLLVKNDKKFDELQKTWNDFRAQNDTKLKDVVNEATLKNMNEAIDKQIAELKASTGAISELDKSIEEIEKEVDGLNSKLAAIAVGSTAPGAKVDPRSLNPHAAEYSKKFNTLFRRGESDPDVGGAHAFQQLAVKAAMSTQSNPDGGYTVPPEMERTIDEVVKEVSPMRGLATVRQVGQTNLYKKLVNLHGTASGWVGETDSRPQTAAATLSELEFPVMEIYAMPAATQELLDDSFLNIEQWLAGEVELEFARQESLGFVSGTGTKRPRGFITDYPIVADSTYSWGNIGYYPSGAAGAFVADPNGDKAFVDVYYGMLAAYRNQGTWLANRKTIGAIRKLKDTMGRPLIEYSIRRDGLTEELIGRPMVEFPDMPDIAANSYAVAYGDWKRGYLIIDRIGIRILRDPFTAKPYVLFYTTKRVGGGVQNFEAIKLMKFSVS
jgi:HK97 family phage major capsid protein